MGTTTYKLIVIQLYIINNKRISKQKQAKYSQLPISRQTVRCIIILCMYVYFCSGHMLKVLGTYAVLWPWPWRSSLGLEIPGYCPSLHHWVFMLLCQYVNEYLLLGQLASTFCQINVCLATNNVWISSANSLTTQTSHIYMACNGYKLPTKVTLPSVKHY